MTYTLGREDHFIEGCPLYTVVPEPVLSLEGACRTISPHRETKGIRAICTRSVLDALCARRADLVPLRGPGSDPGALDWINVGNPSENHTRGSEVAFPGRP